MTADKKSSQKRYHGPLNADLKKRENVPISNRLTVFVSFAAGPLRCTGSTTTPPPTTTTRGGVKRAIRSSPSDRTVDGNNEPRCPKWRTLCVRSDSTHKCDGRPAASDASGTSQSIDFILLRKLCVPMLRIIVKVVSYPQQLSIP